jgi:hypothetical protein
VHFDCDKFISHVLRKWNFKTTDFYTYTDDVMAVTKAIDDYKCYR